MLAADLQLRLIEARDEFPGLWVSARTAPRHKDTGGISKLTALRTPLHPAEDTYLLLALRIGNKVQASSLPFHLTPRSRVHHQPRDQIASCSRGRATGCDRTRQRDRVVWDCAVGLQQLGTTRGRTRRDSEILFWTRAGPGSEPVRTCRHQVCEWSRTCQ